MKLQFNEKELVFVERIADNLAEQNLKGFGQLLSLVDKSEVKDEPSIKRHMETLLKENVDTYDFLRTLSYKCVDLRKKLWEGRTKKWQKN